MRILIATRNAHKLEEIGPMLPGVELVSTANWPDVPDPVEDGETFIANAVIKAEAWCKATGLPTIADDSGLMVDALDGAPGIYSARYAGTHGDSAANNAKLLAELKDVPPAERTAQFICALALAQPGEMTRTLQGTCRGRIALEPSGRGGFGYDPLFIPDGYDRSFADLPEEVKAHLSHRANAFEVARQRWAKVLTP